MGIRYKYLIFSSELKEMDRFSTKGELLKHLGKNEKDNKLVDRMIAKGSVIKENGMYVLVDKDEIIKRLEREIEGLKTEPKQSEELNAKNFEDTATIIKLNDKIKELESDLDYQIAENEKLERRVEIYQECIRRCYLWAQNVKKDKTPRPEFKKEVLKLDGDIVGEDNQ